MIRMVMTAVIKAARHPHFFFFLSGAYPKHKNGEEAQKRDGFCLLPPRCFP